MKTSQRTLTRSLLLAALLGVPAAQAADDIVVNLFDDPSEAAQWARWWGSAPQTYEFDPAVDAGDNPASGSLKATVQFDFGAYSGDNQFAVLRNLPAPINATEYTNLVMDIRWDSNSPRRVNAQDFGYLEYGFRVRNQTTGNDWAQTWLGGINVQRGDEWIRLTIPINPTLPNLGVVHGIVLKMWSGNAGSAQTGAAVFWVDNVRLIANAGPPPPPPTLAIQETKPGLQLFASQTGNQWQRQNIVTTGGSYSWLTHPFDQVRYSLTIKDYPSGSFSGFQTHIFLMPNVNNIPDPDWSQPHVIFVQVANNADGSGSARFMYKTNQPNGNAMLWNSNPANGPVGTLATLWNPTPLGTWSVTFNAFESITLTSPSGTTTNFTMPQEAMALFAEPLYVYFGIQPNNVNNIGQSALLERVQISVVGATDLINEDFSAPLNPATWQVVAANAPGVVRVGSDSPYWVSWTLPALGFTLEASPDLSPGSWAALGLPNFQLLTRLMTLVPRDSLPPGDSGYFRLIKP